MNVQCPSCETVYRIDPAKVPAEGVRARCAVCSFAIPLPGGAASAATVPTPTVQEPAFIEPPGEDAVAEPEAVAGPETAVEPSYAAAVEEEAPPAVIDEPKVPEPEVVAEAPDVRLSRPFVAPDYQDAAAPVQQVTRPTAPVFKPTPGAPVQDAPMPPVQGPAVQGPAVQGPAVQGPAVQGPAVQGPAVQEAPAPPAQAPPIETAPVPVEDPVVGDIAPAEPETVAAPEPVAPVEEPARPINPFLQRDPKQKARRLARALISDMIVYQPQKRQEALENGTLKEAFEEEIKKSWEEYVDQVGEDMANSTGFFREALNEILAGGQEMF